MKYDYDPDYDFDNEPWPLDGAVLWAGAFAVVAAVFFFLGAMVSWV